MTQTTRSTPHTAPYAAPAFSLIELVIVVVIIGIIAAIAIPRISSSVSSADESALTSSLSTMRRAIDVYAAEHGGFYPGAKADGAGNGFNSAGAFISQTTRYSDVQGQVSDTRDANHPFGPYLRAIPPLPVGSNKGKNEVAIDTLNARPVVTAGAEGWVYNPLTGEVIANSDAANRDNTRAYDEY